MANSWNGPQLGNPIRTDVPELQKKLIALLKQDPTSVADIPSGAKRLVNTSGVQWQVQQYNGSSWDDIGKLMHDVDKLDGYHAAITPAANTVAVRNADNKLEGDITGNAATASSAMTLSETLPVNKGGTGATTSAAARTNLGVPPTSHASSETTYGLATDTNYGHVRSDGDTTKITAGEVVVKDVAIGGDATDLARNRGQIGGCYNITSGIDFNTLFKAGRYWFNDTVFAACSNKPPTNVGGFCDVLGEEGSNNYTKQIYHVYHSPVIYIREHKGTDSGWSETWTKIITEKNLATTSTPGLVKPGTGMTVDAAGALNVDRASTSKAGIVQLNDTVTSTSTTRAATANAVKTAYDKAVAAGAAIANALPVSALLPSFASSMSGFLLCNGAAVSRTTYAKLFSIIGTKFGAGNGSTTFKLPDFRNKTLWGANGNLMAVLAAGLPNFSGTFWAYTVGWSLASGTGPFYDMGAAGTPGNRGGEGGSACTWGFNPSRVSSIYGNSTTVQPPAIAVNIFIKY